MPHLIDPCAGPYPLDTRHSAGDFALLFVGAVEVDSIVFDDATIRPGEIIHKGQVAHRSRPNPVHIPHISPQCHASGQGQEIKTNENLGKRQWPVLTPVAETKWKMKPQSLNPQLSV